MGDQGTGAWEHEQGSRSRGTGAWEQERGAGERGTEEKQHQGTGRTLSREAGVCLFVYLPVMTRAMAAPPYESSWALRAVLLDNTCTDGTVYRVIVLLLHIPVQLIRPSHDYVVVVCRLL